MRKNSAHNKVNIHPKHYFTLLVVCGIIISIFIFLSTQTESTVIHISKSPATIYVGGTGPGNYSSVQAGINAANTGDTVFVYNGTYYENIMIDKTISLVGENRDTTIIDGGGGEEVLFVKTSWTNISSFTIRNNRSVAGCAGIRLYPAPDTTIQNCNIVNSYDGICFDVLLTPLKHHYDVSPNTKISDCNISDCLHGILLASSSNNSITNCTISDSDTGIVLHDVPNNTFKNNTFFNNTYSLQIERAQTWQSFSSFYQDIDTSNIINGMPIYYVVEKNNLTYDNIDAGYLGFVSCSNITVRNLNLTNNYHGILVVNTTNLRMTNCNITNNREGIYFYHSSNSSIHYCNISFNEYRGIWFEHSPDNEIKNCGVMNNGGDGIGLYFSQSKNNVVHYCDISNNNGEGVYFLYTYSSNNTIQYCNISKNGGSIGLAASSDNYIHHNNFVQNAYPPGGSVLNYWDDGTEGNYWDDYTGNDTNGDGIGDYPYTLGSTGQDNFPFIFPLNITPPLDIIPPNVVLVYPVNKTTIAPVNATICITFNEPMNRTSTQNAFSILPSVDGNFSWHIYTMKFTPNTSLSYNTTYNVTVTTDAKDISENYLESNYSWEFKTREPNQPPVINYWYPATNLTITETQSQLFSVNATDLENDNLTYQWYLNDSLLVSETNSSYMFIPGENFSGNYSVKVSVFDGEYFANHIWIVTVINVGDLQQTINELQNQLNQSIANNTALQAIISQLSDNLSSVWNQLNESLINNTELQNDIILLTQNLMSTWSELNQSLSNNTYLLTYINQLNNNLNISATQISALWTQLNQSSINETSLQNQISSLNENITNLQEQIAQFRREKEQVESEREQNTRESWVIIGILLAVVVATWISAGLARRKKE